MAKFVSFEKGTKLLNVDQIASIEVDGDNVFVMLSSRTGFSFRATLDTVLEKFGIEKPIDGAAALDGAMTPTAIDMPRTSKTRQSLSALLVLLVRRLRRTWRVQSEQTPAG